MATKNIWKIVKSKAYSSLNPIIRIIHKSGITPNAITTIGLLITIWSSVILVIGAEEGNRGDFKYITWFGIILLIAGVFDMLDGQLARLTNKMTVFGALFDSVIDRYSEMIMFLGITYYLVSHDYFLSSVFAFIAMIGSIMVSYVRARAEALGYECKVGMMQRPERILTIGISAILYGVISYSFGSFRYIVDWLPFPILENITIFTAPIFILAILTNYTAYQRLSHCNKIMK